MLIPLFFIRTIFLMTDCSSASGFNSSKTPCSYLHERCQYNLTRRGPFHFWQCFERSDDGVVHSHGALWSEQIIDERAIASALRLAGGEVEAKRRARQVKFSLPINGRELGWITYARNNAEASRNFFQGEAYSCSSELRVAGQELYESTRLLMNKVR